MYDLKPKKPIYKRWWFITFLFIVFVSAIAPQTQESNQTSGTAGETAKGKAPAAPEAVRVEPLPYSVYSESVSTNENDRVVVNADIALAPSDRTADRESLAATCISAAQFLLEKRQSHVAQVQVLDRRSEAGYPVARCTHARDGRGVDGVKKWTWNDVAAAERTTTAEEKEILQLWDDMRFRYFDKKTLKFNEEALRKAIAKKLQKKPEEIRKPDFLPEVVGNVTQLTDTVEAIEPVWLDPKEKLPKMDSQLMRKKSYPKMYASLGAKRMDALNKLIPEVGLRVAKSDTCDRVINISYSQQRSSKSEAVFFVDCANKERFYVSEDELSSQEPAVPVSVREAIFKHSDIDYRMHCEEEIKGRLQFPSTYDSEFMGTQTRFTGTKYLVRINFEAKNGFGNELPYVGVCTYDDRGIADVQLKQR